MEEIQSNQFCRACGTELRAVRAMLERPDSITASAVSARDEIGRAVAQKIREVKSAKELAKVVEEALPGIEQFLESPEERRLRRNRNGSILSFIGLGAAIAFSAASWVMQEEGIILVAAMGVVTLFIGLAYLANGMFFSVPNKTLTGHSVETDRKSEFDGASVDGLLVPPGAWQEAGSVTENTTRNLKHRGAGTGK